MATQRINQVSSHLSSPGATFGAIGKQSADDVVIVAFTRTPITRSKGGALQGKHLYERDGEICWGDKFVATRDTLAAIPCAAVIPDPPVLISKVFIPKKCLLMSSRL